MKQDWLVCYRVGLNNGASFAFGDMTVTIDAMTADSIGKIRDHLREDFIKKNPTIASVQNVVFTSLIKLDSE